METGVKKGIKVGLIIISALALVYWLYYITHFFFILFAAILFAVFFGGIANWINKKTKINYKLSVAIVIAGIIGIITLISFLLGPMLNREFIKMSETLPNSIENLKQELQKNKITRPFVEGNQQKPETDIQERQITIFKNAKEMLPRLLYAIVIVVTGFYLAWNPQMYRKGLLAMVHPDHRNKLDDVLMKTYRSLKLWLFARGIGMTLVAILTGTGLSVLGIPLAFPLGIIAGLLDFVPNIGPIVASLPAILIALMEGPEKALVVALLYISIQTIDGYFITPLVEHEVVSLPPALILISQLFFGLTAGTLGVFLASPLLAAIKVFVEEYHIKRLGSNVT